MTPRRAMTRLRLEPMPRLSATDRKAIPGALLFYRIAAYVTGVMLLLLCAEMIVKYFPWNGTTGFELYVGGNADGIALLPADSGTGVNISLLILIAHGWLYVVYLAAAFRLWSLLRWPLTVFIGIALGGVVPFLSFIVEGRIRRKAFADLEQSVSTTRKDSGARA